MEVGVITEELRKNYGRITEELRKDYGRNLSGTICK